MEQRALKRYERGADKGGFVEDGILLLVGRNVDLKGSEVLWEQETFDESSFAENFVVKSGSWSVEDGWVIGKNPDMCPGMIVSKKDFFGKIMLEVTAKMVAPSTHDINIMINGEWNEEKNCRGKTVKNTKVKMSAHEAREELSW